MTSEPTPQPPVTICAWCQILIASGDWSLPPTHGICVRCRDRYLEQLAALPSTPPERP